MASRCGRVDSGLTEVVVVDEGSISARMAGRAEEVIGAPVAAYWECQGVHFHKCHGTHRDLLFERPFHFELLDLGIPASCRILRNRCCGIAIRLAVL